jgi:hypothetical protein
VCNYILVLIFIQEILKSVRWIDKKLFKLIEYMGFIKLIGLNSLEVGLLARKFKVKGQKVEVKRK